MVTADVLKISRARAALASGEATEIRKAAHLSQAEMAAAAGVTQPTVARWEAGVRVPRGKTARRYARVLDAIKGSAT